MNERRSCSALLIELPSAARAVDRIARIKVLAPAVALVAGRLSAQRLLPTGADAFVGHLPRELYSVNDATAVALEPVGAAARHPYREYPRSRYPICRTVCGLGMLTCRHAALLN